MIKKHINLSGFSCYNNLFLTSYKGKTRAKFQQKSCYVLFQSIL